MVEIEFIEDLGIFSLKVKLFPVIILLVAASGSGQPTILDKSTFRISLAMHIGTHDTCAQRLPCTVSDFTGNSEPAVKVPTCCYSLALLVRNSPVVLFSTSLPCPLLPRKRSILSI